MRYLLDDLTAFGIKAYQRTTAAQDYGEERFIAKLIAVEKVKAGLRHAVTCPNLTGMTKEIIAQSKRARAGSLAVVE